MRRRHGPAGLPAGFGVLWTTVAIDLIGFGMVLPILPLYAKRFGASSLDAALLVAAFSGASFICSPLWGRLSDRVGRKPVLLVSLAGSAVGSLLTGLAGGLVTLMVARLVDGASGASISVAQAAAADLAPPGQRARLFGYLGAAFGVGFVAGPAIGGMAAAVGPRVPFFLAAAVAGANAIVAVRRLPETHHPHPAALPRAHLDAGTGTLIAVAFCALVAFSGFEATFALFGHRRLGLGLGSAAGVFAAAGLVIVAVQGGLVGRVVARLGETGTLVAGLVANVAGLALLAGAHTWALATPALLMLTVGQGLVQTTMASVLAGRAGPRRRGQMLGWQQSAGGLARVAGPALGGALIGAHASGAPYVFGAVLTVLALVAVVLTLRLPSPAANVTLE